MMRLELNNFMLEGFLYPKRVNFYDPGVEDNAMIFKLNTVTFSKLVFTNVNIFMLNNTDS